MVHDGNHLNKLCGSTGQYYEAANVTNKIIEAPKDYRKNSEIDKFLRGSMLRGPADVTAMLLIRGVFSCHIRLAGPSSAKPLRCSDSNDAPALTATGVLI